MLGLWTAGWLAVFLVAGMLWLGEPSVQWPVLAVPLLWALVALRPRRRAAAEWSGDDGWDGYPDDDRDDLAWEDDDRDGHGWGERPRVPPGERTDTVERPALRRPEDDDPWERRAGR